VTKRPPPKPKGKPGRPSLRTPELEQEILEMVAEGELIRPWCRLPNHPSWRTVYRWLEEDREFSARFARARLIGCQAKGEDGLELVSQKPPTVKGRIDNGFVQWQRLQFDAVFKYLSRVDPAHWGDKIAIAGDKDAPLVKVTGEQVAQRVQAMIDAATAKKKGKKT